MVAKLCVAPTRPRVTKVQRPVRRNANERADMGSPFEAALWPARTGQSITKAAREPPLPRRAGRRLGASVDPPRGERDQYDCDAREEPELDELHRPEAAGRLVDRVYVTRRVLGEAPFEVAAWARADVRHDRVAEPVARMLGDHPGVVQRSDLALSRRKGDRDRGRQVLAQPHVDEQTGGEVRHEGDDKRGDRASPDDAYREGKREGEQCVADRDDPLRVEDTVF